MQLFARAADCLPGLCLSSIYIDFIYVTKGNIKKQTKIMAPDHYQNMPPYLGEGGISS